MLPFGSTKQARYVTQAKQLISQVSDTKGKCPQCFCVVKAVSVPCSTLALLPPPELSLYLVLLQTSTLT